VFDGLGLRRTPEGNRRRERDGYHDPYPDPLWARIIIGALRLPSVDADQVVGATSGSVPVGCSPVCRG
jgi:hypothetical protein